MGFCMSHCSGLFSFQSDTPRTVIHPTHKASTVNIPQVKHFILFLVCNSTSPLSSTSAPCLAHPFLQGPKEACSNVKILYQNKLKQSTIKRIGWVLKTYAEGVKEVLLQNMRKAIQWRCQKHFCEEGMPQGISSPGPTSHHELLIFSKNLYLKSKRAYFLVCVLGKSLLLFWFPAFVFGGCPDKILFA